MFAVEHQRIERPPDRPPKENALSGRALESFILDADEKNYRPAHEAGQQVPDEQLEAEIRDAIRRRTELTSARRYDQARTAFAQARALISCRSPSQVRRLEAARGLSRRAA